jgi:hypothetical protein
MAMLVSWEVSYPGFAAAVVIASRTHLTGTREIPSIRREGSNKRNGKALGGTRRYAGPKADGDRNSRYRKVRVLLRLGPQFSECVVDL